MTSGKDKTRGTTKTVFENEFTCFVYNESSKEVLQTFTPKAKKLSDEKFLETGTEIMASIPVHCPSAKFLLIDTENFNFTIRPDIQLWVADNYSPRIDKVGIEKVGVIFPEDFFSRLSVEQTAEEAKANDKIDHQIAFFSTIEAAREWFKD
jgi:hypothetical protein